MLINILNKQKLLKIDSDEVAYCVKKVLEEENIKTDEIFIHLVSKAKIKKLHKDFFNDDTITDCITFPIDKPNKTKILQHTLGEVFICPHVAIEEARKRNISPYVEFFLYLIHTLLHLAGYKDFLEKDKKVMRKKEKRCMNLIKDKILKKFEK